MVSIFQVSFARGGASRIGNLTAEGLRKGLLGGRGLEYATLIKVSVGLSKGAWESSGKSHTGSGNTVFCSSLLFPRSPLPLDGLICCTKMCSNVVL